MSTWLQGPHFRIRVRDLQAIAPSDTAHPEDGCSLLVSGVLVQVSEPADEVCRLLDESIVERARKKVGFAP